MTFKQLKENRIIKVVSNKYFIIFILFIVWMAFFDENSFLNHWELNKEIEKLEDANKYYKKQIDTDSKIINNLKDPDSLEKYAREEYKMNRKNEDIYLIEYDTVK